VPLPYDPVDNDAFWSAIKNIEGYPWESRRRLIERMLFQPDALFELSRVLLQLGASKKRPLIVIMDSTPMQRVGEGLKPLMLRVLEGEGWKPEALVLEAGKCEQVRTDMKQIDRVTARLSGRHAVISLGSGSITDIVKQACRLFEERTGHRPIYAAFPTANSMGAYTSNVATVYIRGVKRSLPSRLPDALICDLKTLRDAPYRMTVAGIGDMIACLVSFSDWFIAHRLGMDDSYSEFQQVLMGPFDSLFLEHADRIRQGTLEGVSLQTRFIASAGLGGSILNASTPLSGYEHVISHLIDQQSEFSGRHPASHGTQVALATLLVSQTYRLFLDRFAPDEVDVDSCYPSANSMRRRIESTFAVMDPSGEAAEECWTDYGIKLRTWHENRPLFERFLKDWSQIRGKIEYSLRPPERIARLLAVLDSPLSFDELDPPVSEEQVRFAFLHAPLIRRRMTLGDLLLFLDWDREALWERVWSKLSTVVDSAKRLRDRGKDSP
jgi:glycerol-1-phosphate dehydrogenase [NAD(P)+]